MKREETMGRIKLLVLALAFVLAGSQIVLATDLVITPVEDFNSSGFAGGPFDPAFKEYQLMNTGPNSLWWGAYKTEDWLDLDPEWGPLGLGASTIVTASLNSAADSLTEGIHTDTLVFMDITNDEEQYRAVTLTVTAPGTLEITPAEDFEPSGQVGGPFTPSSKDYQLTNSGGDAIDWSIANTVDWLNVDPNQGTLDPCQVTLVTASLTSEADLLAEGVHTDILTFTDITNNVDQTRGVALSIGNISVNPGSFNIDIVQGTVLTETLTIGNEGIGDFEYMIRTRQVGDSGETTSEGSVAGGIFSVPEGHDFTAVADANYAPGRLIVRFDSKADGKIHSLAQKNQILRSLGGGAVTREFGLVPGLSVVELPEGVTVEDALLAFNEADGILYAEPDYEVRICSTFPDDSLFDDLWGMHNTGQTGGADDADIDAPEAWDIGTGSDEIVVAVIDTGVDYHHVDLVDNMWVNEAEYNGTPGVDDDGNGYVDDIYGYDFRNNDGDPMDDHYHGTHVSGTVGGIGNNAEGVAGVNWTVRIMAVKFLSSGGGGTTSDAISSVEYTTLMGANVSSNSWGGGGYSQGLKDAIDAAGEAGMLFVAAAGNDSEDTDVHPHYPSSYDSESLISVMSTDKHDNKSGFSNWGPVTVDLGAPGSDILSCQLGGGYKYASGTSMATPHVAGACALIWSMNTAMSNADVKDVLLRTGDQIPALAGKCVSEGRLNLYKAILETKAPWIEIYPEEGTIGPGGSDEIAVTFSAFDGIVVMEPGVYQAEIVIISDDAGSPRIVPVTMTISADDLQVNPLEGTESSGTEGGPFEPECVIYTLTNINGTESVNWTTWDTEDWLQVTPSGGLLGPGEVIDVNVCISADANLLDPNLYTDLLTFQNTDSNSIKPRPVTLIVKPPDMFTESFFEGDEDTEGLMLTFTPDGSIAYYEACRERVDEFPTDPNGGTFLPLFDDDYIEVTLTGDVNVLFYGDRYDSLYVGSNGYITFGDGDLEYEASLDNHFNLPRISGLFADLTPPNAECISYKQLDDRIVITYQDVPLFGDKESKSSFQIELFFADGSIFITWLDIAEVDCVVGLSRGRGLPPVFFEESDLNEYPPCWPVCDFTRDYLVNFKDFAMWAMRWQETDCSIPYWCGKTDVDFSGETGYTDLGICCENWLIEVEQWWLWPVSHWKFDEGQGDIAYDSVGGNHGSLKGDTSWIEGQIGDYALNFDGAGDGVYLDPSAGAGSPLNIYDTDLTISSWVKFTDTGGTIVARSKPWFTAYRMGVLTDQAYIGTYKNGPGHWGLYTDGILGSETWYHIVGVFDRNGDTGWVYVNGIKEAEGAMTIDPLSLDASTKIGCRNDTSDIVFNGSIDDVRIYNRVLSDEEVQDIFQDGLGYKAISPEPSVGAVDVDPNGTVSWVPGKEAVSHDVYFGTDFNDVNDANTSDADVFMGNQTATSWDPNGLELDTNYYWRIDELSGIGTTTGDLWNFRTMPEFDPNLDLIGWWQFEEGVDIVAFDSVGGNHGSLKGDTSWVTGQIGDYALDFDGAGDGVYLDPSAGTGSPLNIYNSDLTISSWVKFTGTGGTIVARSKPWFTAYRMGVLTDQAYIGTYKNGPGHWGLNTDGILGSETWYHIVGVFDRNGDTGRVYVNGIKEAEGAMTIDPLSLDASTKIGCRNDTSDIVFNGTIDDVRIYNKVLSSGEIWQIFQEGLD